MISNGNFYFIFIFIYNGEYEILFTITNIDKDKNEIEIAITNQGKISVCTYDLLLNSNGFYFEYGNYFEKIYLNEFVKGNTIIQNDKNYKIKDYKEKTVVYLEFTKLEQPKRDYEKMKELLKKLKGEKV